MTVEEMRERVDKPHIWFSDGRWRVSRSPSLLAKDRTIKGVMEHAVVCGLWFRAVMALLRANERIMKVRT